MDFVCTELDDDGNWVEDEEKIIRIKTDNIISAFGLGLSDESSKHIQVISASLLVHISLYKEEIIRIKTD